MRKCPGEWVRKYTEARLRKNTGSRVRGQETRSACDEPELERVSDQRRGVCGQKDDFGVEACRCEPAQRLQPTQQRHGDVGNDHVGPQLPGDLEQAAVAHNAHEVDMPLQPASGHPERRMDPLDSPFL